MNLFSVLELNPFKISAQLPQTDQETDAHVEALKRILGDQKHARLFDHLYESLTILDGKSSTLLAFNSIIIAVHAILLTGNPAVVSLVILIIGVLSLILSSILLLYIIWIHWSTTDHLKDSQIHIRTLLNIRRDRTLGYRTSWLFSAASMITLVVFVFVRFVVDV